MKRYVFRDSVLVLLMAIVGITVIVLTRAHGRDIRGEFAQYTPDERRWLQEQIVPGKKTSCCNAADGTKAEEDIRGDKYWISFEACYFSGISPQECTIEGPMPVPVEAVLHVPNKIGRPVVWYGWDVAEDSRKRKVWIRCFIPGAKF